MKTNRIPATYNVTPLGESMTPQLSNLEKARACREAKSRANSRARRRHRAQHSDDDKTKMRVAWAIIIILAFAGSLAMCYIQDCSWKKHMQKEPEYSVYIGDGQWVTEGYYHAMQWHEAHPEAFGMEG